MTNVMWQVGDIIQIDPERDNVFGGCLMIVTIPKPWGAQGYFDVPGEGRAYYRVKFENGVRVGHVEWFPVKGEADVENEVDN